MSFWYSTETNRDYFERNIVTYSGAAPPAAMEEPVPFDPGTPLVEWPDYEHVIDWARSNDYAASTGRDNAKSDLLQRALDAATRQCARRAGVSYLAEGSSEPSMIPADIHLAIVMQATKWYFRKDSPDGVVGSDQLNGSIRAGKFDPDVEAILEDFDELGLG